MDVLLLSVIGMGSAWSSVRFRKKPAFDAVIGVVGVLAAFRRGGGVSMPLAGDAAVLLLKDAILSAVGALMGSKFSGGNRNGCRCFFLAG
jgi:hypothetical protein